MIPGGGPNGVYPNHSLGLPIAPSAKAVTVRIFAKHAVKPKPRPRWTIRNVKFPNN